MSSPDISRRLFLRGKIASPHTYVIRPPWSVDNIHFLDLCNRCDSCISACPEKIIIKGDGGYPEVNFKFGECSFCTLCAESCQTNAIQYFNSSTSKEICATPPKAWQLDVGISSKCLSLNAIVCRACSDNCEPQAIRFQLKVGGISEPQVSLDDCTGCGACMHVCPVDAVQIQPAIKESIAA